LLAEPRRLGERYLKIIKFLGRRVYEKIVKW